MNDKYYVAEKNKGRVWTVLSDPFMCCGTLVVKLEGKENATLEEMLEAVEQVKHRAEPKNRPMMLKEVRTHCAKGPNAEPLWVEFREKCTIPIWSFATIAPGVFDRPVLSEWILGFLTCSKSAWI